MFRAFLLICFLFFNISCASYGIHRKAKEHNLSAIRLINDNNLEMAEKHLELALEYNKNYAEAYNNLGIIYLKQNKIDKAERFFLTAIEYNRDFAEAHNNLGYIYMVKGEYKRAQQRLKTALNIDPAFTNARLNLARVYILLGDLKNAEAELLKLKILLDDEEVNTLLFDIYLKSGKISDGFSIVENMIASEKMHTKGVYLRGFMNLSLGRCADAINDFESVKGFYLNQIEFYINFAAAYICNTEYGEAETLLKKALYIKSDEPAVLFNLGRIEYERKNLSAAEDYFRRSMDLGFTKACDYLIDTLFKLGKKEESLKVLSTCK